MTIPRARIDRATEILIRQVLQVLVGVFGYTDDVEGNRIIRVGGSGILIAPFHALTARHVARDLFRTVPHHSHAIEAQTEGYFRLPHSSGLFQVAESGDAPIWLVNRTWDPRVTDINFMEVQADEGATTAALAAKSIRYFAWSLLPPALGKTVYMFGFPNTEIEPGETRMGIRCQFLMQSGAVDEVFDEGRESGLYSFPCFTVDQPIDHGCSGGPVFCEGRLCGLVSGGTADDKTMVASLWPLLLMNYEYPDLGFLGASRSFRDLFEKDIIRAADWAEISARVHKITDERGLERARIRATPPTSTSTVA